MTVHLTSTVRIGENRARTGADSFGRVWGFDNLRVNDASLLPDAPGVNPQGTIMAIAGPQQRPVPLPALRPAVSPPPGFGRPAEQLGYQPALDGVRGAAVLLVLAVHLGEFVVPSTNDWLVPGGFIGVDIFFVLSGFLIGAILIGENSDRSGGIRAREVLRATNRAHRAGARAPAPGPLPLRAWSSHAPLGTERSIDITAVFLVSNWRNSVGLGRFGDMVHLWSVALEMQWYLLAPLIVSSSIATSGARAGSSPSSSPRPRRIVVVRYVEYSTWHDWNAVYQRTDERFDTFLLGLLVAFLWRRGA